jgi:glycosyltransferase involved in cell wall biosynthesis
VNTSPRPRSTTTSTGTREIRLRILVVGDATVASTRYRILAHLPALHAAGFDPKVVFQESRPARRLLRLPLRLLNEIRDLRQAADSDLLLIHRRCYPAFFAPLLRRKNRPMVFDIDDAIYLPSPVESNSGIARYRYRRNFNTTAAAANLVLCGNRVLAERVGKKRKVIVPTAVDCRRFHPDALGVVEHPTAGWVGHSSNLAFLEALAGPLREIAWRHPGFKLIVVADRRPRLEGVPVEYRPWTLENEVGCFKGIGIGLMPLDDSRWTRAKCAFKLLQYMALGIPSVASPVGMNREVIEHGRNGLLAMTEEDWIGSLDELVSQPAKRREIGCAGRETVERSFDLPLVSDRLLKALIWVMKNPARAHKLS